MNRFVRAFALILGVVASLPLIAPPVVAGQARTREQPPEKGDKTRRPEPGDKDKAVPRTTPPPQPQKRKDDDARERERRERPRPVPHRPTPGSTVFIGGYFYDPFYGPHPWWPTTIYPHVWPATFVDDRAHLRIKVSPPMTAVYVDGYYAGIADDFDGIFQPLPVLPGGHTITLYLPDYVTISRRLYLSPRATSTLRDVMHPLLPGATSVAPELSVELPPPPRGTFTFPRTPRRDQPLPPTTAPASALGTLRLTFQPANARVRVDGVIWESSDPGHLVLQLPAGVHRLDIEAGGGQRYSGEVTVREGDTTISNVSAVAP